jgi:hypothetical protein
MHHSVTSVERSYNGSGVRDIALNNLDFYPMRIQDGVDARWRSSQDPHFVLVPYQCRDRV